jgi:hypothetical protein
VLDGLVVVLASGGVLSLAGVVEGWLSMERSKLLVYEDVMKLLRAEIAAAGSQREWARKKRVDRTVVNTALSGRGKLQPKIVKALGLEAITVYRRV